MKAKANPKICFEAAKKASNYREFRSMLNKKGCTLAMLKEAWASRDAKPKSPKRDAKPKSPKFTTSKTESPKKSIKKGALKKAGVAKAKKVVVVRQTPPVPVVYERFLTPISKDRDDTFAGRAAQAQTQSYKIVIKLDLLPIKGAKLNAAEKKSLLEKKATQVQTVISDLLYGYDQKTSKLAGNEFTSTIKANREWIGNESTVIKSVKAVFDDPNFYILHGKNCTLGDQTLKLTVKSIKKE